MKNELSADEIRLITVLRQNAREKLTSISRKIQLPISTIHEKIKRYSGGIIKRHTILLDHAMLGYPIKTHTMLKIDNGEKAKIIESMLKNRHIDNISRINNSFDIMMDGVFRSLNEAEEFFEKMQSEHKIRKLETYYVLDEIKREGFMTNELLY